MSWTALVCSFLAWSGGRRVLCDGVVRLICAGWLPQDELFGWRGAAGLARSGVTVVCRLSIVAPRVSSTLPSLPGRAGNGTRLFIGPWLLLLDRVGEAPAPAVQFRGDGDVGDRPAFMPGFEQVPLVVESVVALVSADPGRFVGYVPAGAHAPAGIAIAVVSSQSNRFLRSSLSSAASSPAS